MNSKEEGGGREEDWHYRKARGEDVNKEKKVLYNLHIEIIRLLMTPIGPWIPILGSGLKPQKFR